MSQADTRPAQVYKPDVYVCKGSAMLFFSPNMEPCHFNVKYSTAINTVNVIRGDHQFLPINTGLTRQVVVLFTIYKRLR